MVGNRTTPAARNPSRGPIQSPKSIQAPDPWMGPIQMDGLPTQQPSDRATRLRLPPGVSDLATQRALFHYAGAISVGLTAVVRAWNSHKLRSVFGNRKFALPSCFYRPCHPSASEFRPSFTRVHDIFTLCYGERTQHTLGPR